MILGSLIVMTNLAPEPTQSGSLDVSLIKFLEGLNKDESQLFSRAHGAYKELRDVGCRHQHWSPEAEYVGGHQCGGTLFPANVDSEAVAKFMVNDIWFIAADELGPGMGYQSAMRNSGEHHNYPERSWNLTLG